MAKYNVGSLMTELAGISPPIESYYTKSRKALEDMYTKSHEKIKTAGETAYRTGLANVSTAVQKARIANTPIEAALQRKLTADVTKSISDAQSNLLSQQARDLYNLEREEAKAKAAQDLSKADQRSKLFKAALGSIGGILGMGVGSLLDPATVEGTNTLKGLPLKDQILYYLAN